MSEQGVPVVATFEPGDTPIGRTIRRAVLDPATGDLSPRTEALLYAADKAQHLAEVVLPALAAGAVVVCDRYVDSMLAYQGAGRVLAPAELESVARWATEDLRPHLTVLLDLDPGEAVAAKVDKDRLEAAGDDLHRRARDFFLALAAADPEHYLVLPARLPIAEIAERVRDRVRPLLPDPLTRCLSLPRPTPHHSSATARLRITCVAQQSVRQWVGERAVGGGGQTRAVTSTVPAPTAAGASAADQPDGATTTGVWADLIGQERSVAVLQRAVAGHDHAMSHAWLITGPPGSGRSNAARAFAAALQCPRDGCGHCTECRTSLSGAHPDVTLVRTEMLSIGVDEVRELVRRASMSPTLGRRQVLVIEDADRVTERGADALLKAIEEPAPRTVWILCAPTADDVVVTIRSRCRSLTLQTPTIDDVTRLLQTRDGISAELAAYAARAAQGHVGRARALARHESARDRRRAILEIPFQLKGLSACLQAADTLVKTAAEEAATATADLDARERKDLEEALGFGTKGARPRQAAAAIKDLEEQQKARAKRLQRDAIDRALTELTGFYRDLLSVQTRAGAPLINDDLGPKIAVMARASTPEATLGKIDALLACREALEGNVAPLLAMESTLISLARG